MRVVVAALVVTVGGVIFGQRNARFFLEPFYWFLMACHLGAGSRPPMAILNGRAVKTLIALQAAGVYAMLSFGVITVLPGAILPSWREAIMSRSANGYAAMRWADEMLPQGITMISGLRSVALAPRAAPPTDWRSYVAEGRPGERVYETIVAARNPEFLLAQTAPGAPAPVFPCARQVFAGPFTARVATRNPSNAGAPYDVWLLRTDQQCLTREASR